MSENAIILAAGKKGSGKTTQLRRIVGKARRALIADPESKWTLEKGDREVRGAGELRDVLREIDAVNPRTRWRIVYRDDFKVIRDVAPAMAFAVRNCTLVLDELVWFCSARNTPDWLKRVVALGRERRVNLLGTTREPQEVPDILFPAADLIYFFRLDPGNGLDRVRRRYPAIAAEIPGLEPFQFRTYGNPKVVRLIGKEGG